MDIASATEKVKAKLEEASDSLGATVKFDFGNEEVIYLDGTTNEVSNENQDAACTVSMELDHFHQMMDGELNPMNAFMGGQMKIDGDMSVAMKLSSVFG